MRMAAVEKAETEKILQVKRAEGEAESKYLSGKGVARQRQVGTCLSRLQLASKANLGIWVLLAR